MREAAGKIIRGTGIYGIGAMLRGLASFILLPLYTSYLTTADYGLVELLSIVLDLAVLLLGSRVTVGIFKLYSDAPDANEKSKVIGSALFLLLIVNLSAISILFVSAEALRGILDAPEDFSLALRIFSLSLIFAAFNEIYFAYLRIEDRPVQYIKISFFKLFVQVALNILFIVYMEMGYWGLILGAVLSNLVVTVVFSIWLLPRIGFSVGRKHCANLVSFSFPIIISSLGMYYITFGDRYFIKFYHTIETVGIYALGYKFGFLLFALIWSPFSTYWSAQQFEHAKQPRAENLFGNVFFFANLILIPAAAGIIVLAPDFIYITAQPGYWAAIDVVPWIVTAYVFQCWTEYIRFGILQAAKTHYLAYATYITVILITGLYIYWIPIEGAVGAAKATLVAFIIRFSIIYYFSQQLFPIVIPWRRIFYLVLYFGCLSLLIEAIIPAEKWAILLKVFLIVSGLFILMFIPIIEEQHRMAIRVFVHEKSSSLMKKISK